jgi:hypothetical protein
MASALGSPTKGTVKAPPQHSAPMNTSVGSGSRPGNVKFPIEDSAPANPHTLDREPFGSNPLGMGKTSQQGA